jgi:hypothetical protein
MIFSTLFIVLFFFSGAAFSAIPDAAVAKEYIKEIQTIIGYNLSPALSSLLSEKENWEFLSTKMSKLTTDSNSFKILKGFFEELAESSFGSFKEIDPNGPNSELLNLYGFTIKEFFDKAGENFFPYFIKLLEVLRDMKDPQIVNKENAAYKKAFEEAPTPVKLLTDLFEAFKKAVKAFTSIDKRETEPLEKLKAALDEPLATVKVPDSKSDSKSRNNNPPLKDEWSNLKKTLVFGGIPLAILAIISTIVFFVLRKSKSAASSA